MLLEQISRFGQKHIGNQERKVYTPRRYYTQSAMHISNLRKQKKNSIVLRKVMLCLLDYYDSVKISEQ